MQIPDHPLGTGSTVHQTIADDRDVVRHKSTGYGDVALGPLDHIIVAVQEDACRHQGDHHEEDRYGDLRKVPRIPSTH